MSFEATVQALAARHGSNLIHPDIIDRGFKACARGQTELIDLMLTQFGPSWINELSVNEAQVFHNSFSSFAFLFQNPDTIQKKIDSRVRSMQTRRNRYSSTFNRS
jgi:hypothetical protein